MQWHNREDRSTEVSEESIIKRFPGFYAEHKAAEAEQAAMKSRIFGTPQETRTPLFKIARYGEDVLFINLSDETLPRVQFSSVGIQTLDNTVAHAASEEKAYENVLPGEAVRIGWYDEVFDSDFFIQYSVTVSSPTLDSREYRTKSVKGGIDSQVLEWQNEIPE